MKNSNFNILRLTFLALASLSACVPKTNFDMSGSYVQEQGPEVLPASEGYHWWPKQKVPKSIVLCNLSGTEADHIMAESLSGLAAQAVNEKTFDEMVWLNVNNADYDIWYQKMMAKHAYPVNGTFTTWELLSRYKQKGIVKGYVLYTADKSAGVLFEVRTGVNISSNIATSLASILQGVLIEKESESTAISMGLAKLADATSINLQDFFTSNKDKLNKNLVLAIDPKVGNLRDLAIAQKAMCIYGVGDFENKVMEWMTPLSPVLGWNCGGEFAHTAMASRYGHFNTASNWCYNLPLLSVASSEENIVKVKNVNPKALNYGDNNSSYHTFVMSDGDNLQFTTGSGGFVTNNSYWANPNNATIPLSWTFCPSNMSMANPYAWDRIISSLTNSDVSIMEYGGGYHYPDLFANYRPNRSELQREFAKRLNLQFKKTGVNVFGFICKDRKSAAAINAYKIFAEELENLAGMYAVQYNPYDDGVGEVMWSKNKQGVDIPVLCPKYSLWANANRATSGGPDKIAPLINADATKGQNFNSTIVHAWSSYRKEANGKITEGVVGGESGVNPVLWTKDKLTSNVKLVSLEELLWRIRMKYRTTETKQLLGLN